MEIEPEKQKGHTNKIEITEKMGVIMKYPNFETLKKFEIENEAESIIKITVNCIDYVYDSDSIYYAKDFTEEELIEFVESMQAKDLEKIKTFFDTMPKIKKDMTTTKTSSQTTRKARSRGTATSSQTESHSNRLMTSLMREKRTRKPTRRTRKTCW